MERNLKAIKDLIKIIGKPSDVKEENYINNEITSINSKKINPTKITNYQTRLIKLLNSNMEYSNICCIDNNSTNIENILNECLIKRYSTFILDQNKYKLYKDLEKFEDIEYNEYAQLIVNTIKNIFTLEIQKIMKTCIENYIKAVLKTQYKEKEEAKTEEEESKTILYNEYIINIVFKKLKLENPDKTYYDSKVYEDEIINSYMLDDETIKDNLSLIFRFYKDLTENMAIFMYNNMNEQLDNDYEISILEKIKIELK